MLMGAPTPPVSAPHAQGALASAAQASHSSGSLLKRSEDPPSGALVWGASGVAPPPVYAAHFVLVRNSRAYQ